MNLKTTLFLVLALLVVGGFFLWVKQSYPPVAPGGEEKQSLGEGTQVFAQAGLKADDITRFTLQTPAGTLEFTRTGEGWEQTAPVHVGVDGYVMKDVLQQLATLSYVEKFLPGQAGQPALKDLALDQPRATVEAFDGSGKSRLQVKLGRNTVGGRGYAMVAGGAEALVVPDKLHTLLLQGDVRAWRKKTIQAPSLAEARLIALKHGQTSIEASPTGKQWIFTTGAQGRVDEDALAGLLGAVGGIYIQKFVADNPKDLSVYGLDKPMAALNVQVGEAKISHGLRIGSYTDLAQDKAFACWTRGDEQQTLVFEILRSDIEKISKTADQLRDARILPRHMPDPREIMISPPQGQAMRLVWTARGWEFAEPKLNFPLDADMLEAWINRLRNARGNVADSVPYQQSVLPAEGESTALTIVVNVEGGSQPEILRFFPGLNAEHWLVFREGDPASFTVDKKEIDIPTHPAELRSKVALELAPHAIAKITVQRPAHAALVILRPPPPTENGEPGPWQVEGQEHHEQFLLEELLKHLTPLRVKAWLPQTAALPADREYLLVKVTTFAGLEHALKIDPATQQASLEGVEMVFQVSPELIAAATAEIVPASKGK